MTQDEIIEMAREAGLYQDINVSFHQALRNFYDLAIAKEREACAKVCEDMTLEWEDQPHIARVELATMMDCALAIRARGEA